MSRQTYILYQKTNPFSGWIRFAGKVDPNELPDGSTFQERITDFLTEYPDSDIYLFPVDTLVDPETQKFDIGTSTLVALKPQDITPKARRALDQTQRGQDIATNLPSWIQVKNKLNSIKSDIVAATSLPQLKQALVQLLNFEEKQARIVYWLAKNQKD